MWKFKANSKKSFDIGGRCPVNKFTNTCQGFICKFFFHKYKHNNKDAVFNKYSPIKNKSTFSQLFAHLIMLGSKTKTFPILIHFALHRGIEKKDRKRLSSLCLRFIPFNQALIYFSKTWIISSITSLSNFLLKESHL